MQGVPPRRDPPHAGAAACGVIIYGVMQALHAFCLADVTLCMPPNDPASFARCLAPYLKVPAPDNNATNQQKRRSAEWLLCVLAIIGSLLSNLDRIAPEAAQDLASDLVQLINSHHYVQVSHALAAVANILHSAYFALDSLLM